MPENSDDIKRNLEQVASQLTQIAERINGAPAMNGGFERLVNMVETMGTDITDIKKLVLGDGEKMGVAHRVIQLEDANAKREHYLEQVVDPAFKEHQKMVFQMERLQELLDSDEKQKKELTLLKERVAILNKIMWLFGSGLTGMIIKSMFEMMTAVS